MQTDNSVHLKTELASELENILSYWKNFSIDEDNGGFVGQRDHYNKVIPNASKGIILNTRILWAFSAIGNFKKDGSTRYYADRAFEYLYTYFRDKELGGVFWEVDAKGNPLNKRKQIYAQAFAVYSLSEYYKLTKKEEVRKWAISLFSLIEGKARDRADNGYFEAFQQDWSPIEDMRLSEKDENAAKTMNTHLHIMEAYTTLYEVTRLPEVKEALENLTNLFLNTFLNEKNQHFQLFFDTQWNRSKNVVSFGHDIEAAWLIIDAAKAVHDDYLIKKANEAAVSISENFLNVGYVEKAGVLNEMDIDSREVDRDRHWWPQVEAMVGLEYAWYISRKDKYKKAIFDIWDFTKINFIDKEHGEWFFRIDENNNPYKEENKLSMWKGPYHNSRACIILLQKL